MNADELKQRTKAFALRVLNLFRALPRNEEARVLGRQLLRSAMSVAANYRAVCRARSRPEFVAKMGVVVEEMDESNFWLEILADGGVVSARRLESLRNEADQLLKIFASSHKTLRGRRLRFIP